MAVKSKMTGLARFLLFIIIITPCVFILASYLRGENPKDNFIKGKNEISTLIGFEKSELEKNKRTDEKTSTESSAINEEIINSKVSKLKDELRFKDSQMDTLYLENEKLKQALEKSQLELKAANEQLAKIKKAVSI